MALREKVDLLIPRMLLYCFKLFREPLKKNRTVIHTAKSLKNITMSQGFFTKHCLEMSHIPKEKQKIKYFLTWSSPKTEGHEFIERQR